MLYEYICANFKPGEPIFIDELPAKSVSSLRVALKNLTDKGKLDRMCNGVYYLPYTTVLGTKGQVSIDTYIQKRFLLSNEKPQGFITGLLLANRFGFTSQNPSCIEVCSNKATTKQRKITVGKYNLIVYKPVAPITDKNISSMQFLDLMSTIDKYSEVTGKEFTDKLINFINMTKVDFNNVKEYIDMYPDKVYKNICKGGLSNAIS